MQESKKTKRKYQIYEKLFIASLLAYPIIQLIIFYFIVNFNSLLLSFQKMNQDYSTSWAGLSNYVQLFKELKNSSSEVTTSIINSLVKFLIGNLISLPLTLLFSYYIYKKFKGWYFFRVVTMLPTILSSMLIGLMFSKFAYALPNALRVAGLTNFPDLMSGKHVFGTMLFYIIWTGFSTSLIIYSNGMGSISEEIIESAEIDGASLIGEIIYIILPLIVPTLTTFLVASTAAIFVDAGPLYVFFGLSAEPSSSIMGYYLLKTTLYDGAIKYPVVSALGVVLTLITFPLTMLVKYLLEKLDPMLS